MSTPNPFDQSERAQIEGREVSDPWKGAPGPSTWDGMGFHEDTAYLGPIYRVLEAAGSGAAKGVAMLSGEVRGLAQLLPGPEPKQDDFDPAAWLEQQARERVRQLTPDPRTTGAATQLVHGLGEGLYLASTGGLVGGVPGAAMLTGGAEGYGRYTELREQGVDQNTAVASGAVTAATAGAGVVMPAAFGSSLITRLATGAAANAAFGIASRGADHVVLAAGGYPEMAEQQKMWDGTQVLTDLVLGSAFGLLAHVHAKAEEGAIADAKAKLKTMQDAGGVDGSTVDAAMALQLAGRDRQSGPGIAADAAAANAQHDALQAALGDLEQGKPVDVSRTGVADALTVARPEAPDSQVIADVFRRSGVMEESDRLAQAYADLEDRMGERGPIARRETAPEVPAEVPEGEAMPKAPAKGTPFDDMESDLGPAPDEHVATALAERPDLEIPTEDGAKPAKEALAAADTEASDGAREIPAAVQAAINCLGRY